MSDGAAAPEYIGWRVEVFVGVFTVLLAFVVALRFYARSLTSSRYGLDDWLVLVALLCHLVQTGIVIGSVRQGTVGYHEEYLLENRPESVILFLKYLVAISSWYLGTIWIAKLSICVLYRRLFPPRLVFILLCITVFILIGTSIATVIALLAACRPFSANWGPADVQKMYCIDKEPLFVWSTLPNIVTDVILLAIPLPIVWRLHVSNNLKLALTFTFLIGSIGLVTSILRLAAFHNTNSFIDATWNAAELEIWTLAESGIYIISACLLVYRPLLEKIRIGVSAVRSKGSTLKPSGARSDNYELDRATYGRQRSGNQTSRSAGFEQLSDLEDNSQSVLGAHWQSVEGPTNLHSSLRRGDENAAGITRTTVIEQSWDKT